MVPIATSAMTIGPWQQIEACDRKAERDAAKPDPGQHQPVEIEALGILAADRVDVAQRHEDAEQADRDVDQEDPVPGQIGGDEAAERRADHRADQRRHRDPGHRIHQRALVDRAQQHQPSDRRHHRAADALQDARDHEIGDRGGQRAADRADHEDGDGDREHHARAEPVGGPAARRNEHRQRQQIRGDGELQRQRAGADIGGDRRQRGRDDRRIHVLHEQGGGHDERDQAFFVHQDSGEGMGKKREEGLYHPIAARGYCGTPQTT